MPPALSVAVLAYNEAENLRPAALELLEALHSLGHSFELLIVNDGSKDETGAVADGLGREFPSVRVIHHPTNLGLGGGYRTGFTEARGERLIFYPADGQFPAEILVRFYREMDAQGYAMVLGYLPNHRRPLVGRVLSLAEKLAYRALVGPMPRFQGLLMFETRLLERFPIVSTGRGWGILLEFIVRCARGGVKMQSLPTDLRPRASGQSKVENTKTVVANVKQLLLLREAIRRTPPDARPLRTAAGR